MFQFLQKNKLFVHYITVVVVILGVMALLKMQREARPNVNFHRVAIAIGFPGAAPSDIEKLIIDPIEEKIAEIDGIDEFRSVSFSGAGSISVKIDDKYPEPSDVVDEIRRNLTGINSLPAEIDDPVIREIKAINRPVLKMALYGSLSPFQMKLEVEKLKDFLRTFKNVQSVNAAGLADLQLKVLTNPEKLNFHDMTLLELTNGVSRWARQKTGGLLENNFETANLTVGYDYNSIEKLKNFIVRSNDFGKKIQLSDVAKISYDTESTRELSIFADKNAILLTVVKKPFADIITTVESVKEGLKKYQESLPKGLEYKLYADDSVRVSDRLKIVTNNAIFGLCLVLLLLIIFLDWRSALVTSIGIPVAILGGILVVYLMGNTMNSLVLVGMIIVLGMLVDDAIVVCENIYFHLEKGVSPVVAAIQGVKEISIPVLASVLTTVFAFSPIIFMEGIMGQFLRVIPLTVVAMLVVSLFEALLILPVHATEVMRAKKKKEKKSFFKKIEEQYEKYIKWSLSRRWLVLLFLAVFSVASVYQGKQLFNRFTLFPANGLNGIGVRVELDRNTPIDKTVKVIKLLSKDLESISEGTFDSVYATVGSVTTGGSSGSRQNASHLGVVNVVFVSDPSFGKKEKKIVSAIKKQSRKFAKQYGVKTSITLSRHGPPIGKPVQFQITSRDFNFGEIIVNKIKGELKKIKGVHSLESDLDGDSLTYRFIINNSLAVAEGVSPDSISQTIFSASTGKVSNEILINNEKVEILIGVDKKSDFSVDEIMNLKVRNTNGQAMPLESFVKVIKENGPSSIQRLNGVRTITLFGEVDEKIITGKEANKTIKPFIDSIKNTNPTVGIVTGGGERDRKKALKDTMRLYGLAILLIFMVISLSFKSLIYPFVVLLAIPMGLCGVVWALRLHGQPFSMMGIIGVVGLSGVVVNVSIIFLKFVQEKIQQGESFHQSIVQAGVRRLRPIIITTITTLVGLLPTIYGIGGVDTFVQPMALVLGWGLFVATVLTLLTLPVLISLVPWLKK